MCSSKSCSFIARISDGRAANKAAPEFSGGGSASADPGSGGPVGTAAPAPADMAVTATSSIMVPWRAFPDPRMP